MAKKYCKAVFRVALGMMALMHASGAAHAAGMVHVTVLPRQAQIGLGESVTLDIWADWSGVTGGLSMAGFKFDVIGNANGTLTGDVNNDGVSTGFTQGVNNGIASGANLLDMGGGQLPPGFGGAYNANPALLGTVTFTDSGTADADYSVSLSITDYTGPDGSMNVYIGASGSQSRSSLIHVTGENHMVTFDIRPFDVVVPGPGVAAFAFAGFLVVPRRRRMLPSDDA